jgi:hypothetical protein
MYSRNPTKSRSLRVLDSTQVAKRSSSTPLTIEQKSTFLDHCDYGDWGAGFVIGTLAPARP